MRVEYLNPDVFEAKAQSVLDDYQRRFGPLGPPVIPVDEILECVLGLTLRFGEVKKQWGDATLGATILKDRTVWIDVSLEPETFPEMEASYRFTLAHEGGHWVFHRDIVTDPNARLAHAPTSVPTWGAARKAPVDRIEYQANRFAEALLMPDSWLRQYWRQVTGGDAPYDMTDELAVLKENNEFGPEWEPAVGVAKTLAPVFRVSAFAMQIRLKNIGLLVPSEKPIPAQ